MGGKPEGCICERTAAVGAGLHVGGSVKRRGGPSLRVVPLKVRKLGYLASSLSLNGSSCQRGVIGRTCSSHSGKNEC